MTVITFVIAHAIPSATVPTFDVSLPTVADFVTTPAGVPTVSLVRNASFIAFDKIISKNVLIDYARFLESFSYHVHYNYYFTKRGIIKQYAQPYCIRKNSTREMLNDFFQKKWKKLSILYLKWAKMKLNN